jgi:hypothetical protein
MGIVEKLKQVFDPKRQPPQPTPEAQQDSYLGTELAATGVIADVSTSATDPALRDVGAAGVQPVAKPAEIERLQNPEARAENEVVRKG